VQYTGANLSLDGTPGLDATGFSLLGGAEGRLNDVLHLGAEAGVDQTNANDSLAGRGRVQSAHAGLYAFADAGPLVLSAAADARHSRYRVNRQTGVGVANAGPGGHTTSIGLQAAWPWSKGGMQLMPRLGVLYLHQSLESFDEHLASSNPLAPAYAVSGTRSTYTTMQPYAALTLSGTFRAGAVTYLPQLELGYRYDTRGDTPAVAVTTRDGTPFALPGASLGRGMASVGARITARAGHSWSLYLDYQGLFASHLHDNALTFGFNKQF
jgi:uncharacterized protein with beta-barrel porin domain